MERMTGLDASFLYGETESLHMHTLKVAIFPRPPVAPELLEKHAHAELAPFLSRLPPFRRRVVEVPFAFHHPVWIQDPDFDLSNHIRVTRVAEPGGREQMDETISRIASIPLDRGRPLWEVWLLDGLADDRIAAVVKVHHAVADGMAAAQLLNNALAGTPGPRPAEPDPWAPEQVPGAARLLADALRDHLRGIARLPGLVVRTVFGLRRALRWLRKPPVQLQWPLRDTPRTPLNGSLSPERSFASASISRAEVDRVRRAYGVTVTGLVVALVSGSLRLYLARRGALPRRSLLASIPVSVGEGERLAGNRLSNLIVSLCTRIDDPVRRLRAIHASLAASKDVHALLGEELLGEWSEYAPPGPWRLGVRQMARMRMADRHAPPINVIVSSVPGPREPLYWNEQPMLELYSVGPILEGVGLNVTTWSYGDTLGVVALSCPRLSGEVREVVDGMQDALDELLEQVSVEPAERSPDEGDDARPCRSASETQGHEDTNQAETPARPLAKGRSAGDSGGTRSAIANG